MAADTRTKMLEGAVRLLAVRGLQETSFGAVLEATGTPRGSIYHHFPGGKEQLAAEAVDLAGAHALAAMESFEGEPVAVVTARFLEMWRRLLVASDFRAGCSVLAVTVAADSQALLDHTAEVFRTWRLRLAALVEAAGVESEPAQRFATTLIAASEGAVVLSRAERSLDPFELVAGQLEGQAAALDAPLA